MCSKVGMIHNKHALLSFNFTWSNGSTALNVWKYYLISELYIIQKAIFWKADIQV